MSPKGVNELMSSNVSKSNQFFNSAKVSDGSAEQAGSRAEVQSDAKGSVAAGGIFGGQHATPQERKNYQDTKSDVVRHGHILAKTVEIVVSNNRKQPDQYPMTADEQAFVAESSAYLEKGFFDITQDRLQDILPSSASSVEVESDSAPSASSSTLGT